MTIPSVYLSVRLSVTLRYCVKMTKRIVDIIHRRISHHSSFFTTNRCYEILTGLKYRKDMKIPQFSASSRCISETVRDRATYSYNGVCAFKITVVYHLQAYTPPPAQLHAGAIIIVQNTEAWHSTVIEKGELNH